MSRTCSVGFLVVAFIILNPSGARAQGLKVTLLGTGHPYPSAERFGPSTLVKAGSEEFLFDCGRGVSIRLWQLRIPMSEVTEVFLTHLHSDHIVGFPDFWLTGWLPPPFGRRTTPLHVYGPAGTREMILNLQKAYQADIQFRIADEKLPPEGAAILTKEVAEGVIYDRNGVRITAFDVDHGEFIKPALGYRINYHGQTVVISGDTRFSENLIRFSKGADVLIHEVASAKPELLRASETARRIIGHHTTPEEAGKVFDRVKPRLAVYTHIVLLTTDSSIAAPTVDDIIAFTRKTYSGRLEVGEDLMSIECGDSIHVYRPSPLSQKADREQRHSISRDF